MVSERRRWSIREEAGYRDSADQIEPNVQRFDELSQAAVARIERDAEGCPFVSQDAVIHGHGRMRVSQAAASSDNPELQIFFTIHDPDDGQCSLWNTAQPEPEF